ncbi:hypothetical protein SAMN02745111_02004 [Eubacterium uniforme]|uniref:Uncharacterized protein n=1 Tax=Eubacterium uniforme TaxID=39495 RepID=A0A1T4VZD5_9FIRM|nr:hypothetical protein [Eubacterium uniforme]SKA70317.1 hypothetical protein SAMN02745111_02004 [Eubacterium uniforme]
MTDEKIQKHPNTYSQRGSNIPTQPSVPKMPKTKSNSQLSGNQNSLNKNNNGDRR